MYLVEEYSSSLQGFNRPYDYITVYLAQPSSTLDQVKNHHMNNWF